MDTLGGVIHIKENILLHRCTTIVIVGITVLEVAMDTVGLMAPGHRAPQFVLEVSSMNHNRPA